MWKEVRVETLDQITGHRASRASVRMLPISSGRVRNDGDAALRAMSRHVVLEEVAVSEKEIAAAYDTVDGKVVESLVKAEERIRRFHELQRPRNLWLDTIEPGIVLGVKTTPLNRVGIYVPGGVRLTRQPPLCVQSRPG